MDGRDLLLSFAAGTPHGRSRRPPPPAYLASVSALVHLRPPHAQRRPLHVSGPAISFKSGRSGSMPEYPRRSIAATLRPSIDREAYGMMPPSSNQGGGSDARRRTDFFLQPGERPLKLLRRFTPSSEGRRMAFIAAWAVEVLYISQRGERSRRGGWRSLPRTLASTSRSAKSRSASMIRIHSIANLCGDPGAGDNARKPHDIIARHCA